MKKYLFLLFFVVFNSLCFAQEIIEEDGINTILGSGIEHNGGYGAFELKLCPSSDYLFWVGGRGGWIINRTFSIGGAGYGLMTVKSFDCPIHSTDNKPIISRWTGGYGGLFMEYINSSNNIVHFTGNLLVGAGGLTHLDFYSKNALIIDSIDNEHAGTAFFIIEPGLTADINFAKVFRLGIGVSYKFTPWFEDVYYSNNNISVLKKSELEGLAINLSFKFGKF